MKSAEHGTRSEANMSSIKAMAIAKAIFSGGGGGEAVLIDKTVTDAGLYRASSDNADGYKTVNVDISDGDEVSY